jgi:sarcosine oxidase
MVTSSDFAVIGAGVMGSAAAQWLASTGARVVLMDQYPRGHTRGGSHGDSRIFRLAYAEPDYARLALESLAGWRQLEEECGQAVLATTGGVDHGPGVVDAIGGVLGRLGLPFEVLGAEAAMARWPGMRFEGDVVYQPDAGRLHADRAVAAFQTLAEDRGATLRFECPARIDRVTDTKVVVATEQGAIEAGVVILAAGAWAPGLAPPALTGPLPLIRVTHEEPAYFPVAKAGAAGPTSAAPTSAGPTSAGPTSAGPTSAAPTSAAPTPADWPAFVHYDPGAANHTFAGYGLPVPGRGVKVGLHASGAVVDPAAAIRIPSPALAEQLAAYVAWWLPGLDPHPTDTVSCIYDSTPDEDFVIDRRGRVVVATGFSGHGFKFAPAIGRLVGQLAQGNPGRGPHPGPGPGPRPGPHPRPGPDAGVPTRFRLNRAGA